MHMVHCQRHWVSALPNSAPIEEYSFCGRLPTCQHHHWLHWRLHSFGLDVFHYFNIVCCSILDTLLTRWGISPVAHLPSVYYTAHSWFQAVDLRTLHVAHNVKGSNAISFPVTESSSGDKWCCSWTGSTAECDHAKTGLCSGWSHLTHQRVWWWGGVDGCCRVCNQLAHSLWDCQLC